MNDETKLLNLLDSETRARVIKRATSSTMEPDELLLRLIDAALAQDAQGMISVDDPCQSLAVQRDRLETPALGLVASCGDDPEEVIAEAGPILAEELAREGLPTAKYETRSYTIGRGWSATEVVILVTALAHILSKLKSIDEGVSTLGKWVRAIRAAAGRLNAGYTVSFLKAVCIEDAMRQLGVDEQIDVQLLTASVAWVDGDQEAAVVVGHYTVTIPIPARHRTFVYIINDDATIIDRAELKYPISESTRDTLALAAERIEPAGDQSPEQVD
jgi:hypothetical protein